MSKLTIDKETIQKHYEDYINGKIKLKEIPSEVLMLTREFMIIAVAKDPLEFFEIAEKWLTGGNLPKFIEGLPLDDLKKQELYDKLFDRNPEKYFEYIPNKFKTQGMCDIVFKLNPEKYFEYIPDKFKNQGMCNIAYNINPEKNFEYIPDEFKIQMYDKLLELDPYLLKDIPDRFKTQEMCTKAFRFYFATYKYAIDVNDGILKYIPDRFKTQEMYDKLFKLNPSLFKDIPDEFKTKSMYIFLLENNIEENAKYVPQELYNDEEILAIVKLELKKLITRRKEIELSSELFLKVIELYPGLIRIFSKEKFEEEITRELYWLIEQDGTIEDICEKYDIVPQVVNDILEKIKVSDIESYEKIRAKLNANKNNWFQTMMRDVDNLNQIILSLGNIKGDSLDIEQKIKFSYLCSKFLHHPLEEIYNINYQKYSEKDTTLITRFFNKILKYRKIFKEEINIATLPEVKTILFNNGWLKDYDRDKFFGIKDGVPTIQNKYGKNAELLTINTEQVIIEMLKAENIPLKDIIVKSAFKEYFKDNLFEYTSKLKSYDQEFEETKKKGRK